MVSEEFLDINFTDIPKKLVLPMFRQEFFGKTLTDLTRLCPEKVFDPFFNVRGKFLPPPLPPPLPRSPTFLGKIRAPK